MKFIKLIGLIAVLILLQLRVGYADHLPGTTATLAHESRVLNYYVQKSHLPLSIKQDVTNFGLTIEDLLACLSSTGYNSEDPGVPVSCADVLQIAIQVYEALAPYLADMEWPFPAVYVAYIRTRIALYAIRVIY